MLSKILLSCVFISAGFTVSAYAGPNSADIPEKPGITGDDSAAVVPEALPHSALQPSQPTAPDAVDNTRFNWRRDKNRERSSAEPVDATTKAGAPGRVHSWETGANKSYLIPALEIPGFLGLLNIYDRLAYPDQMQDGKKVYSSTFESSWHHLRYQNWAFDEDPFSTNQFAHPYQGATMYGFARSSGLNFWESLVYSNAGSFLWKMAGETDPPSINDQITTGNAGSLLGEALFRMAGLVLEEGGDKPDVWHEIGAAIVSPPTAVNRYAFGERFKSVFPSHQPATFWRTQVGVNYNNLTQTEATMDFAMSYGLPGKPGYSYTRPLDYFDFEISGQARASNPVNNVLLRGLLYGKDYEAGDDYRGIWGLYGSYDYLSPSAFRVSTTALSLGTTGQYWVAPGISLQGSILGGVGFGGAGVSPDASGERDYHYGVVPQGLLALRLLFGNRAALELISRGYYVTGSGTFGSTNTTTSGGSEGIVRVKAGFNVRVYGRHGLGLQYVESIRQSQYGNLPGRYQSDGTLSLVYTFLGDSHFGAVEWRDSANR